MSGIPLAPAERVRAVEQAASPRFGGVLRGEVFKITRLRLVWAMTVLLACLMVGPYLIYLTRQDYPNVVRADPLTAIYLIAEAGLAEVRVFGGVYMLILAALVVGMEYQQGTVRILLGRGVGRLQLLSAKILALAITGLALLAGGIVLDGVLTSLYVTAVTGRLNVLQAVTPRFWSDMWLYALSVAISLGVTLLLGVAVTVVGRSLAFGIGVGLGWFAADNLGVFMLYLVSEFTRSDFWLKVSAYLLGPTLNVLPALIVPNRLLTVHSEKGVETITKTAATVGFKPLVPVTSTHALWLALAYAVVFAVVAFVLTWRRDVRE